METIYSQRLHDLRDALAAQNLQALWITAPANVQYLTGFTHPEDARALVTPGAAVLYTDERYIAQAKDDAAPGVEVEILRPAAAIEAAADRVRGLKVGVEAPALSLATYEALQDAWQADLHSTSGIIENMRLKKSDDEIKAIRQAQDLADRIFAEVRPQIQAGKTEADIASLLEQGLRRGGAGTAFDTIVASGERGAYPHGTASTRALKDGDLVTVDFGALLGGYNSDMTRTVAVGEPSDELKRMYMAVLEAEEASLAAIRPGITGGELDRIARDILAGHGLDKAFNHSLGHGVGLEVHESPRLASGSQDVLEAGMVVTVEPGVYVEGVGGVRIEDLVLVTEDGHEVLSRSEIERF